MTKSEKVVAFYTSLLATLDIVANDDGLLEHSTSNEPIMIDGKRLALPTKENIRLAGREEVVVFHPLSENVFEGMSEVFIELRHIVTAKLHKVIVYTAYTLLKLVLDKASHEGLSNKQMGTISNLSEVDDKFLDSFKKLMNKLEVTGNNQLINIFMKYGGTLKDTKYMRIAFVSFPLLELIEASEDYVIHDVKFRKKDMAILKAIFTTVIPRGFEKDAYSAGSSSSVAPYFSALLLAMCNVLEDTASTTWRFRSYIEDEVGESQHITAKDISDQFTGDDNILDFVNAIPPMPYNTGDNVTGSVKDDAGEERAASRATRTKQKEYAEEVEIDEEVGINEMRAAVDDAMGISRPDRSSGGLRGRDNDNRHGRGSSIRNDGRTGGLRDNPDIRGRGYSRRAQPTRGGLRDQPTNYRVSSREDMDDLRRGRRGESTNPVRNFPRMRT